MSSIASLYNVPGTVSEWAQWSFAHAAHHRDIIRVIYERAGFQIQEYPLDPFNPADPGAWLASHQTIHFQQDQILGISPYDLSQAVLTNPQQSSGWIFLNAEEHRQAADLLGIG